MKRNLNFCVFVMVFFLGFSLHKLNADSPFPLPAVEPEISMDLQDANLKDILKILSMQSGLNFIASEGVQERKITLYLNKVPLEQAMDKLFKANNLSYELYKDANIFIVKDLGKLKTETVTKVFHLKNATVSSSALRSEVSSELSGSSGSGSSNSSSSGSSGSSSGITQAITKLLSDAGSVVEDPRTNSLIVTDTPMRVAVVSQVIASLDVAVPQVLLEVEMLDVSKNNVDKLGVNWPSTLASLDVTGSRVTNFPFSGSKANADNYIFTDKTSPSGNWEFSSLNGSHFAPSVLTIIGANLTLEFLRTQTDTKFLARPKILTLNNETAEIKIATQESIGITSSTSGSQSLSTSSVEAERSETGVVLRVTPQVNPDTGEVTMMIYPKVAEAVQGNTFTSGGNTYQFRDPEERSTKSLVRLKDGETVIIGGLIRNEMTRQETKVPILGSLPLVGWFFRHTGGTTSNPDKNKERELLVFITPHIIKDVNMAKDTNVAVAKSRKDTLLVREQYTGLEGSRSTSVNSALNNFKQEEQ